MPGCGLRVATIQRLQQCGVLCPALLQQRILVTVRLDQQQPLRSAFGRQMGDFLQRVARLLGLLKQLHDLTQAFGQLVEFPQAVRQNGLGADRIGRQ